MADTSNTPAKPGRPKGSLDKVPRKKRADQQLIVNPGDNAKITLFNMKLMGLPPIDRGDREQVENRIIEYFEMCIDEDMKPGTAGLCLSLGITRQAWQMWGSGKHRPGYEDLVEKSRLVMESIMECYMLNGKINPVTGIFLMKSSFPGYRDQSEVIITSPTRPLGEVQDLDALAKKYLDNAYIADEDETRVESDPK
ncbi:MAG: DNA-packaging protein [Clostridiales bacterium]|nr:DNA-packaging protein [Clostridiales bacterium]